MDGVTILDKLNYLPTSPGVYIYKNKNGKVIYVGKALNLKNRVKSYFQTNRHHDAKTTALVRNIYDLEYIVTDTEAEALILEDTLIKKYKPKYNVMLRDDKTYPFIKITNEEYPRIFSTRRVVRDGSKYFGPYADVKSMKRLIKLVRSIFKLRSCKLKLTEESIKLGKFRVCLDYQIKKCDGPCEGLIAKEKYIENVKNAISLINGKTSIIEKDLLAKMESCVEELNFEQAAYYRNQYFLLKDYTEHQKIVTTELIDRDVFGFAKEGEYSCVLVLNVREGKLVGRRHFILKNKLNANDADILQAGLEKFYLNSEFIPEEILLPMQLQEEKFLSDYIKSKKSAPIDIIVPKIGEKKKIVNLANENAKFQLQEYILAVMKKDAELPKRIFEFQKELQLKTPPRIIECFDNSHIQGSDYVSSLVVFKDGKPWKRGYRKFKIKTVNQNDDYAAMREAIYRRYRRLLDENGELPNLIIIDGGKGQLHEAESVLKELEILDKVDVIGIAKRLEEIFKLDLKESIVLPRSSTTLQLIQQIRDEAHRFAVSYHRKLREKRTITTELLKIKGVGAKVAKKLLNAFGSVAAISGKSPEELKAVVGDKLAQNIYEYFHSNQA